MPKIPYILYKHGDARKIGGSSIVEKRSTFNDFLLKN